jgi:hypothetical protein
VARGRAPAVAAPRVPAVGRGVDRWRAAGRFGGRHSRHDRRRSLVVGRAGPVPWRSAAGGIGPAVPGAEFRLVAIGIHGLLPLRVADGALGRHHPVGTAGPVRVRVPDRADDAVSAPELVSGRIVGTAQVSISTGVTEQVGVTVAVVLAVALPFAVGLAVAFAFAFAFAVVFGSVVTAAVVFGSGVVFGSAVVCGSVVGARFAVIERKCAGELGLSSSVS